LNALLAALGQGELGQ